jgi:predicted RNA-binding Zn-ribbon protein involved in translation (DUF1610 family)
MTIKRMRCPKCGGDHAYRTAPATEWEELHCPDCGLLVHVGALRARRDEPPTRYQDEAEEAA